MAKTINNIYEYFSDINEKDLTFFISELSNEDKECLHKVLGKDLINGNRVLYRGQNKDLSKRFIKVIAHLKYKINQWKLMNHEAMNTLDSMANIESNKFNRVICPSCGIVSPINAQECDNCGTLLPKRINKVKEKEIDNKEVTESDIIKLLHEPFFIELTTKMPLKRAIILSMFLGYVNNKRFSSDKIAELFNLNIYTVKQEISEGINTLRNKFNEEIDKEINSKGYGLK